MLFTSRMTDSISLSYARHPPSTICCRRFLLPGAPDIRAIGRRVWPLQRPRTARPHHPRRPRGGGVMIEQLGRDRPAPKGVEEPAVEFPSRISTGARSAGIRAFGDRNILRLAAL